MSIIFQSPKCRFQRDLQAILFQRDSRSGSISGLRSCLLPILGLKHIALPHSGTIADNDAGSRHAGLQLHQLHRWHRGITQRVQIGLIYYVKYDDNDLQIIFLWQPRNDAQHPSSSRFSKFASHSQDANSCSQCSKHAPRHRSLNKK